MVTRVYGSTEVPVTTVGAAPDDVDARRRDRRPAGIADIKLVRTPAPAGEGEIHVRGPQMLVGYLHPEDERDSFDADGYFRTGDLGRWVDDDYLVVTGRAKDLIIRNGENISAQGGRGHPVGHPQIAEIAVVGIPDARTGERACAVIVPAGRPAPGRRRAARLPESTTASRSSKPPSRWLIWDALPKNDAGKVLKHQIRADAAQAKVGE